MRPSQAWKAAALLGAIIFAGGCGPGKDQEIFFSLLPQPDLFTLKGKGKLNPRDVNSYFLAGPFDFDLPSGRWDSLEQKSNAEDARLELRMDPVLEVKEEGYEMVIGQDRITLTGKDGAGLFYGLMTLDQLMQDALDQHIPLPRCTIRDDPELSYRAVHLDMKHHRDRLDYYFRLLDELASLKINAVIAEMEDKLAYRRQPEVGSADALTMEEWIRLSDYAHERHIEISPLIQGLGHASFVLKHERYKGLRDDPGSDWAFNPLDPGTYEAQFDLYLDAMEATPYGKYLHVGGDEVNTTGRGSGMPSMDLQLNWLNRVCKFAGEYGRIPIFWDDMPLKHAGLYDSMFDPSLSEASLDSLWKKKEGILLEYLDRFPENCIYMRWNYSNPGTGGNNRAMEWFTGKGLKVMGATAGQTRWVLMPQNGSNMENIRTFASISEARGLDGLLLTLWDDDSPHFELYKRGIAAFAEYTWSGDVRPEGELKSAYRHRAYGPLLAGEEYGFVDRLEYPVAFWNNALLKAGERRQLMGMDHPLEQAVIDLPDPGQPGSWSETYRERLEGSARALAQCDSVERTIRTMKKLAMRNRYRLEVYEQVNLLARFTPRVLLALQRYDLEKDPVEKQELLGAIGRFPGEFLSLRREFDRVYGETRILNKPENYILDQDHHRHLANQALNMDDWLLRNETLFLEKLGMWLEDQDQ